MTKFPDSLENGPHKMLLELEGEWRGICRTWFEPGVLSDESPMEGTIKPVLGGRFILHEYEGILGGKPFAGLAIIGCSLGSGNFQMAWVDSFHNGTNIMFSESKNRGELFTALGSYAGGDETWGWRTEIMRNGPDEIVITAYNITPSGEEAKATETIYKRAFSV